MKKIAKFSWVAILLVTGISNIMAQQNDAEALEIEYDKYGNVFYIKPHPSWSKADVESLPARLKSIYKLNTDFELTLVNVIEETDRTIEKYYQSKGGVLVETGDILIHRAKNGEIKHIIGTLRNIRQEVGTFISPQKAIESATTHFESEKPFYWDVKEEEEFLKHMKADPEATYYPKPELAYACKGGFEFGEFVPCYRMEIRTSKPARNIVYVNAITGEIESSFNNMDHIEGTGTSLYSGNVNIKVARITEGGSVKYWMHDSTRNIFTLNNDSFDKVNYFEFQSNTSDFSTTQQKPGVDVHYGMSKALDYYKAKHNRNSYDNAGAKVFNVAHHKIQYNNAFWDGSAMYYGDGDGTDFTHWVGIDIVGHEFSHAVVEKTAGLVYRHESGAINESVADVFGHCIQSYSGTTNWKIGEDNYKRRTPRNMDKPNLRNHPQARDDANWRQVTGCIPTDDNDECGVHSNSGVGNFWFFLLTDGKSGTNTVGKQYEVTAIGRDKAADVVYNALSRFMTSGSNYDAYRKATLLYAEEKYGKNSNEYKQICNAWYAVNVGEKCCGDSITLEFDVTDATCPDKKDGEIDLTVKLKGVEKTTDLIYKWYKGDTTSAVFATSQDVTGLDTGSYAVWVKDTIAKCEVVDRTKVEAPEPIEVSISGGGIHVRPCDRRPEIYLEASASGGKPPYTYNWGDDRRLLVASQGSIGASGMYTAVVTDKNNCKGQRSTYVFFIPILCSYDPNDIIGPPSYGDEKFVARSATLPYKIRFENDPDFATAPASRVTVDLPLDSNFDLNSFRVGNFGFDEQIFTVPDNKSSYYTRLDLRDSMGIYVDVTAGLNKSQRKAFWIFESIDPATGLPPTDGNRGFLPVNDTTRHNGEGFVDFTIKARSTSVTGDSIRAKAEIVFDDNPSIFTPRVHNIIDAYPPVSSMDSLPYAMDSLEFTLSFKATDDAGGSGVGTYNIYVSENKGALTTVVQDLADSTYRFKGNQGASYDFYCRSADNVGNTEALKSNPDLSLVITPKDFLEPLDSGLNLCVGDTLIIGWSRIALTTFNLEYTLDSGMNYATLVNGVSGADTQYVWIVPQLSSTSENIYIRAVSGNTDVTLDSTRFFTLTPSPAVELGPDTFYCQGIGFSLTLNAGAGHSSYLWDNSSSGQTRGINTAGTYSVTVTNALGCTAFDQIQVVQKLNPTLANKTVNQISCPGQSDGSVNITIVSGNPPYNYLWSHAEITEDISNLSAGTYFVMVTDSLGCKMTDTTVITTPAALLITSALTHVKCKNGADGAIDINVTGGTSPYSYLWSNSANTQDINSLTAGTYSVQVTDNKNCKAFDTLTITEPALLTAGHVSQNVNCFNGSNGSVNLTVGGGTSPYTFLWSNAATTEDLSGLTAGTYSVIVTDANNCQTFDTVVITQPTLLVATHTFQHVKCKNGTDGSIDLSVSGGTSPYSYLWSNSSTSQDLSGLNAGTYSVTVTDAKSCIVRDTVIITEPSLLVASHTFQPVKCKNGNDGSVDLTVSGGTSPYTYAWSNSATSQDINTLTAGRYTVVVTDANNCIVRDTIDISEPTQLVVSHTFQNVKCKNGNNGSIDLTVSGGTAGYVYLWSNSATSQDISGLSAGQYTVRVTDANNCIIRDTVVITEPNLLVATHTFQNVKCKNAANGSVDLTVTGGVSPYTYAWSNSATSQDLSNLAPGTYSVLVTDANNCTVRDTVVITEPNALLASHTSQNVKCKNGNDGSIDLTISGGTTPYSYAWSNSATTQDISGLIAGRYIVVVTDANNCVIRDTVDISEPTQLVKSHTFQNVKCKNGNDGSIDLTVSGGTPGYTYLWSNSATTQDISGLVAGQYTVRITDANNCIIRDTVVITEPTLLVASHTFQNVKCKNGNDGFIDLTIAGGTSPYTYIWSNSATSQDISNLVAGRYIVVVTDANNCVVRDTVDITEPTLLTSSFTSQNVKCKNGTDGSADLTVNGGTTPYTYLWNNSATTQDISNIGAGRYTVTITDANNCQLIDTVDITEPTQLVVSNTFMNVKCKNGNDGAVNLTVSGGTTPYTFLWSNAAVTEDISGLTAGTYIVLVTDNNNCTIRDTAVISEPTLLTSNVTVNHVLCYGGGNGNATVIISGGTSPYTYNWSTGESVNNINGKSRGTYILTTTDANLCVKKDTIEINEPLAPLSLTKTLADVKCFGGNDGSVDITPAGGTAPYQFNWSNSATTEDITNLTNGTYILKITDFNNCELRDTSMISQPLAPLSGTFVTTPVLCFAGNSGSINLTMSGGTPNYTYLWSNAAGTEDIATLSTGWYKVTVRDANNCVWVDSAFITQPAAPLTTILSETSVNCFGGADGSIQNNVSGGTMPYSYLWSNASINKDLTGVGQGRYSVTITDANNCIYKDSIDVTQPAAPLTLSLSVDDVDCNGGNSGLVNSTVNGGTLNYTYSWNSGQTTPNLTNLVTGWYILTVTDARNCQLTDSAFVDEPSALTLVSEATSATSNANNGKAWTHASGATPPYTYLWNDGSAQNTDTARNLQTGIYIVTVTDAQGCVAKDTVEVIPAPSPAEISMFPNPNGGTFTLTNLASLGLDEPIYIEIIERGGGRILETIEIIDRDIYTITLGDAYVGGLYFVRVRNSRGIEVRKFALIK